MTTSVAAAYLTLRAFDYQLEIARATAQNYEQTVRLFDLRFKGGDDEVALWVDPPASS